MKTSKLVARIQPSLTRRLFDLAKQYENVIDFTLGDPDYATPDAIRQAACDAILSGKTRYSANAGLPELREAAAEKIFLETGVRYDPESEIMISVGAMQGLFLALCALLDPGDEVVIPSPHWVNYKHMTEMLNGIPVLAEADEAHGFVVTKEVLRQAVTDRTRVIILNSPNNPTGAVYGKEILWEVAQIAVERDITVLWDECYKSILYDGATFTSILEFPGMKEHAVVVNSCSKRYAMTGWRIGYLAAPSKLVSNLPKLQENMAACAPLPSQYAAIQALRKDTAETRKELQRAWDKTYTAKVDTVSATQKTEGLLGKVKQLGRKVVSPVIKAKDTANATISKVCNGIKAVGKKVASPVIRVKDAATLKIKSIKNAITGVAKKVTTPVIKLKDAVTSKVTKISGKLKAIGGKVFAPIVKLKDATAKGISAIGSKLKALAKATVIPVTIAAAVVGGAVKEGAALEQSIGGVETLFKENAGVVKANAESAFKTAGLSANDYMEQVTSFSASLLSSLGGDTAKAADIADMAMIDMADNANKFGTDMEAIQNAYQGFAKQNYTMLDNLKLGYGGTQEEMQRLLQDAEKISGVKYEISNLSDVYSAIHVIQNELGVTGTTAEEAGQTFSGSFSAMKAAAKNLLGNMAIGGDVTGSMEQLVNSASTFLFDNAVPMIGRVMSSLPGAIKAGIKKAVPKIKTFGKDVVIGLKEGLQAAFPSMAPVIESVFNTVITAIPNFVSGIQSVASVAGTLAAGFAPILPQLASFGNGMVTTIQQVVTACVPAFTSIISTVQTMLPAILPVIQTVITTVGNIIAQAAPVIAGLVEGIGTVVSALAPVFGTIFSEIGEKVGSVLSFVGERMGFIQEVIGTVAPLIGDIIGTAWGVISPIIDIVISVFEVLFSVVQKVFPGIQKVLETVWGIVKPLVEGIGNVIGEIAGWFGSVADAITGAGGDSDAVGKNAEGTNNWKGGLTWVGEKGAELVDLPRGSRILPHKESISLTNRSGGVVKDSTANITQKTVVSGGGQELAPVITILTNIDTNLKVLIDRIRGKESGLEVPSSGKAKGTAKGLIGSVTVAIAKLADEIIVREDADIDEIADKVAKKVVEVVVNMG